MNSYNNLTVEEKIDEILKSNGHIFGDGGYSTTDGGNVIDLKQQLISLIKEEKIKELEMIDATRHYGKDYQESLDEVEEYLYNRLQALKQENKL